MIERETYRVILSVDERQHSETKNIWGYNVACELSRMSKVMGAIPKPVTFGPPFGFVTIHMRTSVTE